MPEKTLNKVLQKAAESLKSVKGSEDEIAKIKKLLAGSDKKAKREYIRERVKNASEADKANAEAQLKNNVVDLADKKTLKESQFDQAAGDLETTGKIMTGVAVGAVYSGILLVIGKYLLAGVAIASVPLAVIISVISTLLVAGITTMIIGKNTI